MVLVENSSKVNVDREEILEPNMGHFKGKKLQIGEELAKETENIDQKIKITERCPEVKWSTSQKMR